MNKRIKQLVNQATTRTESSGAFGMQQVTEHFDKEKFAELILKKAIAVIRANYVDHGTTEAVIAIEQHFGLEE